MLSRPRAATRTARSVRAPRLLAAATLPLVLALSACGGDDDDDDDDAPVTAPAPSTSAPAEPGTEAPSSAPAETPTQSAGGQSPDEASAALVSAAQTALQIAAGTVVTVDANNGGWEVSIVDDRGAETEIDVDAAGTSVVGNPRTDVDDADDRDELLREAQGATVDYEAALTAAAAQSNGQPVDSVDLDSDNGTITWNVQFGDDDANEVTVVVDAATGEVIGTETDD